MSNPGGSASKQKAKQREKEKRAAALANHLKVSRSTTPLTHSFTATHKNEKENPPRVIIQNNET